MEAHSQGNRFENTPNPIILSGIADLSTVTRNTAVGDTLDKRRFYADSSTVERDWTLGTEFAVYRLSIVVADGRFTVDVALSSK